MHESLFQTLQGIREFVDQNIIELETRFLSSSFKGIQEDLEALRTQVKRNGWWGLAYPRGLSGDYPSLPLREFALVSEVLGRSPLGHYVFGCQAPEIGNIELLAEFANSEQKKEFLSPLLAGEGRSCFAMTEKLTAGSNPTLLATTARQDGEHWILNGEKWFTTAADGASFAICMAVTDADADPHRRATMFMVPTTTKGYEFVRNIPVMGHQGDGAFSHAEIRLSDCRVPDEYRLGRVGDGFKLAQSRLGPGRIHHCMRWIGICQRALDMMIDRAAERQISRSKFLLDSDICRAWIAESAASIQAARLFVLNVAERLEKQGFLAVKHDISLIKFYVADVLQRVVDRAIQVHGALGMTDDTILAFFYREERAARIYDGPDEVHKLSVAKQLIKHRRGEHV